MKKLEIIKTAVSIGASVGVGAIVGNVVKSTTPSDVKKITKLLIGFGSLVLTGLASDMASKYTEDTIDETVAAVKEAMGTKKVTVEEVSNYPITDIILNDMTDVNEFIRGLKKQIVYKDYSTVSDIYKLCGIPDTSKDLIYGWASPELENYRVIETLYGYKIELPQPHLLSFLKKY